MGGDEFFITGVTAGEGKIEGEQEKELTKANKEKKKVDFDEVDLC